MTPAARIAAAIEILDRAAAGQPAEQVLTNWARANRYAGSSDRRAIRDLVFDALRARRSLGWRGGAGAGPADGRALMLGLLRQSGVAPADVFTGTGHAPAALRPGEAAEPAPLGTAPAGVRLDCPDWLLPLFAEALGETRDAVLLMMQKRAPLHIRVNPVKSTKEEVIDGLSSSGIIVRPHPLAAHALEVEGQEHGLRQHPLFLAGAFEFQDAASQALVELLPLAPGMQVLDYCAGGGGKSLAIAARAPAGLSITAHDIAPARMADLPARAGRAGAQIAISAGQPLPAGGFDLVLCDAPCSGSGAWRRAPEGKWRLTPEGLAALNATQAEILASSAGLVAPGGRLVWATCSLLAAEDGEIIAAFVRDHPEWSCRFARLFSPLEGGDGFYTAHLTRD